MYEFDVVQSTDGKGINVSIDPNTNRPIGDPSAFAWVYRTSDGQWVIKLSNDKSHDERFDAEYDILKQLAEKTQEIAGNSHSPDPVYRLKRRSDGMPALAMPFYDTKVRNIIAEKDERWVVEVMLRYINVVRALNRLGYVCMDRKTDDLFWHEGRLVVIDWNVLKDSTPEMKQSEVQFTAGFWYTILTGKKAPQILSAFDDDSWNIIDPNIKRPLVSIGLRWVLSNAINGVYESSEDLYKTLASWQHWSNKPDEKSIPEVFAPLSDDKAKLIWVDFVYQQNPKEYRDQREELRDRVLNTNDALADLRGTLSRLADTFSQGSVDEIHELLRGVKPANAIQEAALARWERLSHLLDRSVDRSVREDMAKKNREFQSYLEVLERPIENDKKEDLERVKQFFEDIKQSAPQVATEIEILEHEASLRLLLLESQNDPAQDGDQLKKIIREEQSLGYQVFSKELRKKLERDIERLGKQQTVRQDIDRYVGEVHQAMAAAVTAWEPPEKPDFKKVYDRIEKAHRHVYGLPVDYEIELDKRLRPYRQLLTWLPNMKDLPYEQNVAQREWLIDLQGLENKVNSVLNKQFDDLLSKAERYLDNPTRDNVDKARAIIDRIGSGHRLISQQITRLDTIKEKLEKQEGIYRDITGLHAERGASRADELIRKASEKGVPLAHPGMQDLLQLLIRQASDANNILQKEYPELLPKFGEMQEKLGGVPAGLKNLTGQQEKLGADLKNLTGQQEKLGADLKNLTGQQEKLGDVPADLKKLGLWQWISIGLIIIIALAAAGAAVFVLSPQLDGFATDDSIAALQNDVAMLSTAGAAESTEDATSAAAIIAALSEQIDGIPTQVAAVVHDAIATYDVTVTAQIATLFAEQTAETTPISEDVETEQATEATASTPTPTVTPTPTPTSTSTPTPTVATATPLVGVTPSTEELHVTALTTTISALTLNIVLTENEVHQFNIVRSTNVGDDGIPSLQNQIDNELFVLRYPLIPGEEGENPRIEFSPDTASSLATTINAALAFAGEREGELLLIVQGNTAAVALALPPGDDGFGELALWGQTGGPTVLRTFVAQGDNLNVSLGFTRLTQDRKTDIEAQLGDLRLPLVSLPEPDSIIAVQVDDDGRLVALPGDNLPVSFAVVEITQSSERINVRSTRSAVSRVLGKIPVNTDHPLMIPLNLTESMIADDPDYDTFTQILDQTELLAGNTIAIPGEDQRIWYFTEVKKDDETVYGWLRGDTFSTISHLADEAAPQLIPMVGSQ